MRDDDPARECPALGRCSAARPRLRTITGIDPAVDPARVGRSRHRRWRPL